MAFEPVYEKITAKGQKVEVCERFKVESKTDVNTDTVDKIINVNAYALIGDTVAEDGIVHTNTGTVTGCTNNAK